MSTTRSPWAKHVEEHIAIDSDTIPEPVRDKHVPQRDWFQGKADPKHWRAPKEFRVTPPYVAAFDRLWNSLRVLVFGSRGVPRVTETEPDKVKTRH